MPATSTASTTLQPSGDRLDSIIKRIIQLSRHSLLSLSGVGL
ncbi:hypothetical protein VTH82DRAFT_2401 [Thermothelomyces myriococcoides]